MYVGGSFSTAGGLTVNQIARWDGGAWQRLGSGTSGSVYAVAIQDGNIYVGGGFITAGGKPSVFFGLWSTVPRLDVNEYSGAPGSTFTFTAECFPPESAATITVNNYTFPSLTTDADGKLTFAIHTAATATEGLYGVRLSVNPQALTWFVLDADAPLRTAPGLIPLELPESVQPGHLVFLPLIKR